MRKTWEQFEQNTLSMMSVEHCLKYLIIFVLKSSVGQNNGFKPAFNYQNIGRQTNPTSNVLPGKTSFNSNFGKTSLQPKAKASEDVPHLEVMDFYVPSHPYAGEDFEMTCGYKHQEGLALQRIEWHRNKVGCSLSIHCFILIIVLVR